MATSVTVTGTFHDTAGRPARGRVSFALAQPVAEPASDVVFDTTPVDGRLDLTGHFSVVLIATDDPGLVPVNVTYRVTESITGLPARSYSIIVPLSAAGTGLDLADVTPVVPFVPAQLAQPLDADLTAIAALDSAQSGVIASDGAGWLRKTYAQLKAALGITAGDVAGLGTIATHAATDYLTPAAATTTYQTGEQVENYVTVVSGVTDCTAAINTAITAAVTRGVPLVFGPKVYMTQGGHVLPSGVTIIGAGMSRSGGGPATVIRQIVGNTANVFQTASWGSPTAVDSGITLRNFSIDGQGAQQTKLPAQAVLMASVSLDNVTPQTVTVNTTAEFPSSGYAYVGLVLVSYTGKTLTTLTGCLQNQGGFSYFPRANALVTPLASSGHGLAWQASLGTVDRVAAEWTVGSNVKVQGNWTAPAYETTFRDLKVGGTWRYGLEVGENAPDNNFAALVSGTHCAVAPLIVRSTDNAFVRPHLCGDGSVNDTLAYICADNTDLIGPLFDKAPYNVYTLDLTVRGGVDIVDPKIVDASVFYGNWAGHSLNNAVALRRSNSGLVRRGRLTGSVASGNANTTTVPYARGLNNGPIARGVGAQNLTTISAGSGRVQVESFSEFPDLPTAQTLSNLSNSDVVSYTGRSRSLTHSTANIGIGAAFIATDGIALNLGSADFQPSGIAYIARWDVGVQRFSYTGWDGTTFTGVTGITSAFTSNAVITQNFFTGVTGASGGAVTPDAALFFVTSNIGGQTLAGTTIDLDYGGLVTNNAPLRLSSDVVAVRPGWSVANKPSRFSGTAVVASGGTTITVAHGLWKAPDMVSGSPQTDLGAGVRYTVTADATNITVTLTGGTAPSNVTFSVWAETKYA